MRRVESSDGIAVNIMDWLCVRYAVLIIPLIAGLAWYAPYQEATYIAVASDQLWTYLFPNLRRVLNVPFTDPQRMSGTLVFLDVLFVFWFVFVLVIGPKYVRAVKGWRERLAHYGRWESCKLMLYGLLIIAAGGVWIFRYDGKHSWIWGGLFYEHEIVFVLANVVAAWWVTFVYLMMIVLFLKLSKE